jgi:hypothetical protein
VKEIVERELAAAGLNILFGLTGFSPVVPVDDA